MQRDPPVLPDDSEGEDGNNEDDHLHRYISEADDNDNDETTDIHNENQSSERLENESNENAPGRENRSNIAIDTSSFHQVVHPQSLQMQSFPQYSSPQDYLTMEQNHGFGYHHFHSNHYPPAFPTGPYGYSSPHPSPNPHFYTHPPHIQPYYPPGTNTVPANNVGYPPLPPSGFSSPTVHNPAAAMSTTTAMAHAAYHEHAARMRDHAAAYANAAAGAAWAAAQIANAAAEFASSTNVAVLPTPPNHPALHPSVMFPGITSPASSAMMYSPNPSNSYSPSIELASSSAEQEFVSMESKNKTGRTSPSDEHGRARLNNMNQNAGRRNTDMNNRHHRKRLNTKNQTDIQLEVQEPGVGGVSFPQGQQRGKVRRRLRSDCDSSTTSSGSSFMPASKRSGKHPNNKKARSDESLRGKTAVAALFEWCTKRQITPNFVVEQSTAEEFDCLVYLDGYNDYRNQSVVNEKDTVSDVNDQEKSWGRGRGRNKGVAKQEAARRTLQNLLPGVIFDDATGILLEVPTITSRRATCNSLDDLAPNLAKQLAIGQRQYTEGDSIPTRKIQQSKRTLDIYPGTSTTSDDGDDENTYYTSRGASVCSVLLHAIVQIDTTRIPEGPTYTYHVAPLPQLLASGSGSQTSNNSSQSRKSSKPLPAVRAARGSFTCTARLKVRLASLDSNAFFSHDVSSESERQLRESNKQELELVSKFSSLGNEKSVSNEDTPQINVTESVLEASGIGGTKREARHVASARLLALLFPQCKDMVEVKAAAEAMREKYAATKAQHKQQRQFLQPSNRLQQQNDSDDDSNNELKQSTSPLVHESLCTSLVANSLDPPIPAEIQQRIRRILGPQIQQFSNGDQGHDDEQTEGFVFTSKHFDRTKQIDYQVECALQMLNDRDEEGRTLPEELTAQDVGRLLLRRAEPEDLVRIRHFQFCSPSKNHRGQNTFVTTRCNHFITDSSKGGLNAMSNSVDDSTDNDNISVSSNGCIVLLLCRAIAAYEDPPLGCAILSLGFSIEKGCLLQIVEIARERHLPMERFLDCLQSFAGYMKSTLETTSVTSGRHIRELSFVEMLTVLDSHLGTTCSQSMESAAGISQSEESQSMNEIENKNENRMFGSVTATKLQSVKEESEVSDSTAEKRLTKHASKPSKRSRFE